MGDFIFGYNVHMGLKSQVEVTDVFAKFRYDATDHTFHEEPLVALQTTEFQADFQYLYKYYKKTFFAKFMIIGPHLLMIFQISEDVRDVKVFKWLIEVRDSPISVTGLSMSMSSPSSTPLSGRERIVTCIVPEAFRTFRLMTGFSSRRLAAI